MRAAANEKRAAARARRHVHAEPVIANKIFEQLRALEERTQAEVNKQSSALSDKLSARKMAVTQLPLVKASAPKGTGEYIRTAWVLENARLARAIRNLIASANWTVNKRGEQLTPYDFVFTGYTKDAVVVMTPIAPKSIPNYTGGVSIRNEAAADMLKYLTPSN